MALPEAALLDTSVLLRFFEVHRDRQQPAAENVRQAWLEDRIELALLDLSVYEFVNVLVRRLGRGESEARDAVAQLFRLRMPMVGVDSRLAAEAASLAATRGLSGYDAAFVAAGRSLGAPLITADRGLHDRAGDGVVLLASLFG